MGRNSPYETAPLAQMDGLSLTISDLGRQLASKTLYTLIFLS